MTQPAKAPRRLAGLREHQWSPLERAIVIAAIAIVMGALFVTSYSLALGDPVPHDIEAALVGDAAGHERTVAAVQRVAEGSLDFGRYPSRAAALHAIDEQQVYAALFQVRANAGGLSLRSWAVFVPALALAAGLAFTLVDGPLLDRLALPVLEGWVIVALQLIAVMAFASLMAVTIGRWAIIPTWIFFVIFGNSSSGGAVAPPLLPHPFDFLSQWLPSGATVTALRDAVYFQGYQHAHPFLALSAWAIGLYAAMLVVSQRLDKSPGGE